jgi:hypothetical protein
LSVWEITDFPDLSDISPQIGKASSFRTRVWSADQNDEVFKNLFPDFYRLNARHVPSQAQLLPNIGRFVDGVLDHRLVDARYASSRSRLNLDRRVSL